MLHSPFEQSSNFSSLGENPWQVLLVPPGLMYVQAALVSIEEPVLLNYSGIFQIAVPAVQGAVVSPI